MPKQLIDILAKFSIPGVQFIYLNGIFEILVGLSLVTGVFTKIFSLLAIIFLILVLVFTGINEATIRDFGLIGGFLAVFLWPSISRRF